ncbi:MAG: Myblike DNAbinding domain-containing protein, variant 3 [Marteilia pararefringens]
MKICAISSSPPPPTTTKSLKKNKKSRIPRVAKGGGDECGGSRLWFELSYHCNEYGHAPYRPHIYSLIGRYNPVNQLMRKHQIMDQRTVKKLENYMAIANSMDNGDDYAADSSTPVNSQLDINDRGKIDDIQHYLMSQFCDETVVQTWNNVLSGSINRSYWTEYEDERLIELVAKYNSQNWMRIADELGTNRSPFQCIQHYFSDIFESKINSNPQMTEVEEALFERQLGRSKTCFDHTDLSLLSYLCQMKPSTIFHAYNSKVREKSGGVWSVFEDERLYLGYLLFGRDFSIVSTYHPFRSITQCSQRFASSFETPKSHWNLCDDLTLIRIISETEGKISWKFIQENYLSHRSPGDIRTRYVKLLKFRLDNLWVIDNIDIDTLASSRSQMSRSAAGKYQKLKRKCSEYIRQQSENMELVFSIYEWQLKPQILEQTNQGTQIVSKIFKYLQNMRSHEMIFEEELGTLKFFEEQSIYVPRPLLYKNLDIVKKSSKNDVSFRLMQHVDEKFVELSKNLYEVDTLKQKFIDDACRLKNGDVHLHETSFVGHQILEALQ